MSTISNQPPAMSLANESLSPDGLEPGESGISQAEITPDPRSAIESKFKGTLLLCRKPLIQALIATL
jgi:hypothetical protein